MPKQNVCDKCGGTLQHNATEHTYTCPYCGAVYEDDKQKGIQININLNGDQVENIDTDGVHITVDQGDGSDSSEPHSMIAGMTPEEIRTLPREEVKRRLMEYRKTHPSTASGGCVALIVAGIFLFVGFIIFMSTLKCDSDTSRSASTTISTTVNGIEVRFDELTGAQDFSEGLGAINAMGDWGYTDTTGRMVIPISFDEAKPFHEGMAAVRQASRWGYINNVGTLVINYQFNEAKDFSEGMAAVQIGSKWGYINNQGSLIIPTKYREAGSFVGGMAYVATVDSKYLVIDKTGRTIKQLNSSIREDPSEGFIFASFENGYGYMDATGKILLLGKRSWDGHPFHQGLAAVRTDNGWCFINKQGVVVIPPQFAAVHDFSDGWAAVQFETEGDWAFIDGTGKVMMQLATSEAIEDFSEGVLAIKDQKSDLWGYIGKNGAWVLPPQYRDAGPFKQGWAHVRVEDWHENYVNKNGTFMFPIHKKN